MKRKFSPQKFTLKMARAVALIIFTSTSLIFSQNTNPGGCTFYEQPLNYFVRTIEQGSDDANESLQSGSTNIGSTWLPSQNGANTTQFVFGLRFDNVIIPANAIVEEVYLTFSAQSTTAGPGAATIQVEDAADPSTYTSATNDITGRPTTASTVNWSIPRWAVFNTKGVLTQTPNLLSLYNELLGAGWTSGNAMSFIVDASQMDQRVISSYERYIEEVNRISPTQLTIAYRFPEPSCSGVSGFVFEDQLDSGAYDGADNGIQGITVNIYDDNGLAHTTVTDGFGNWGFAAAVAGTVYRVEYVYGPEYLTASASTLASSTEAAFATAPECCLDFGLHPANHFGCADPQFVTVCNVKCASDGSEPGLLSLADAEKSNSTTSLAPYIDGVHPVDIPISAIGSTWGLAYNKSDDLMYLGAKWMHSSNIGPGGFGAIYCIDNSTNDPLVDGSVGAAQVSQLATVANAGTAASAPWGTCVNSAATTAELNQNMQDAVRIGLGDVDLAADNKTLYTINLNTRELVVIPVDGCSSGAESTFAIPTPALGHDCVGDELIPFGVKYYHGKVYIGVVCNAVNTQNSANLWAYVFTYTPGAGAINATPVLEFPLDYPRGNNGATHPDGLLKSLEWQPWRNSWNAANPIPQEFYNFTSHQLSFPQPVLSDIEFHNGNMILAFMDRFGEQFGHANDPSGLSGVLNAGANTVSAIPMGDILHAGANGNGTWTIENNASSSSVTLGQCTTLGADSNQGIGNGEFYWNDNYAGHAETINGGLVQIPGNDDILATAFDPTVLHFQGTADARWGSGGAVWLDNKSGAQEYAWEGYRGTGVNFGKGNGFGDIEYICDCPDIQIGNRIWFDADEDGIQDPSEEPIAGVVVNIYDPSGNILGTTTTDVDGRYYFDITNVAGGLQEFSDYFIGLDPSQFSANGDLTAGGTTYGSITSSNSSNMGEVDVNDNDSFLPSTISSGIGAIDGSNVPYIPISTERFGANDFTLDFGFKPQCQTGNCGTITVTKN